MFKIKSSCPTRIDLAGGTLDLWPLYHQLQEKATLNVAIDINAEIEIRESSSHEYLLESIDQGLSLQGTFEEVTQSEKLPLFSLFLKSLWNASLPPIEIRAKARSPKGAGLGGSSSLSIALCAALFKGLEYCNRSVAVEEDYIVAVARDIESTIIKSPTGYQDYWAAVRGGVNLMTYDYGGPKVETLNHKQLPKLSEGLVLVYSGQSRASAMNNWSVYQKFFSHDSRTVKILNKIGKVATECLQSIKLGDTQRVLTLSEEEWNLRKELWPSIATKRTEFIDKTACENGASFTRVCGAGGGGVMSVFISPDQKDHLKEVLHKKDIMVLDAHVTQQGLTVTASES